MKRSGLNLVGVKEFNRSLILQNICTGHNMTRQQLAKLAKLSTMTVTNLTSELLAAQVIMEEDSPDDKKGVGRSPKILTLSPDSPVVLGVWISKDFLYGAVSDLSLRVLHTRQVRFAEQESQETVLAKLGALAAELAAFTSRRILGLGIAVIGVIDMVNGSIQYVTDFFDIHSLPLRAYLERQFSFPIFVANDMQASGLAELYFGHGRTEDNFLYVGVDNGIGSAVVSDRELLCSPDASSGELGHMSIDYNGPRCTCGSRGCLEFYASATNILAQINRACQTRFTSFQEAMEFCSVSSRAYAVLADCSRQLAYALNSFINIIDISTVIFGHAGFHFPDEILSSMAATLSRISVLKGARQFRFLRSTFGDRAPMYGAACVVLAKLFSGDLSL